MKADVRKLVVLAIEQWEEAWRDPSFNRYCPLCHLGCSPETGKCPIFLKVGASGCRNTPYWEASAERDTYLYNQTASNLTRWHRACRREINFLRSLLTSGRKGRGK
jgi:hypothetical protein